MAGRTRDKRLEQVEKTLERFERFFGRLKWLMDPEPKKIPKGTKRFPLLHPPKKRDRSVQEERLIQARKASYTRGYLAGLERAGADQNPHPEPRGGHQRAWEMGREDAIEGLDSRVPIKR